MLCLECGAEMRLVQATKDTTMLVPGYEHHTWQCTSCSTIERRMTFTHEKTSTQPVPEEPTDTAPIEPAQTAPVEPTLTAPEDYTAPMEPSQTRPVETTVAVEAAPTMPAELTIQNLQPPRLQKNAWTEALDEKLQKPETAASETERRAEFNRFLDSLRPVPSPSAPSEASSARDEPTRSPTELIASPAPAHDEPIAPGSNAPAATRLRERLEELVSAMRHWELPKVR